MNADRSQRGFLDWVQNALPAEFIRLSDGVSSRADITPSLLKPKGPRALFENVEG